MKLRHFFLGLTVIGAGVLIMGPSALGAMALTAGVGIWERSANRRKGAP